MYMLLCPEGLRLIWVNLRTSWTTIGPKKNHGPKRMRRPTNRSRPERAQPRSRRTQGVRAVKTFKTGHLSQEVAAYVVRPERFVDLPGAEYSALHSSAVRRTRGITFTPPELVEQMVAMAAGTGLEVKRIVDPGAGTGRFTIAAARAFPKATVVAIEYDRELAGLLLGNLTAAGLGDRVQVHVADYRTATLPRIDGATLFIGNPPYVRHHDIHPDWKRWYSSRLAMHGVRGSQLAGLHAHFIVKTFDLAHEGDIVCFVTSAEWLDTNYGSALRALLLAKGRDADVALLDPATPAFADAMTTSAVVLFRFMRGASSIQLRRIRSLQDLTAACARGVRRTRDLSANESWSRYAQEDLVSDDAPSSMLGELFSVHRGQVTGNNLVWIEGRYPGTLPDAVLFPAVTRAKDLLDLDSDKLMDAKALKRVIDLPSDLVASEDSHAEQVSHFLEWASRQGAQNSYIARHRRPWFRVGLREPAPIVMTYMARRAPKFVRNLCGARLINIAHGLYPREPIRERELDLITQWLNANVSRDSGRTYAGGLTKFEPGEVERIRLPSLAELGAGR